MKLLVIAILYIFSIQSYLQAAEPTNGLSESRKVFLDAMENPIIAENFHVLQLQLLMSPADQQIDNLFKKQVILSQFYNLLMSHQDDILKGFVRSSLTSRVQLVRGLAPYYDTLDALVVKTMVDMGFTKEAISNRKIFIQSGTMNAFTVSGSSRQVIIVFNHDILEQMSLAQVAGVLTHELGHVRAGHTIKGAINNIFLNLVTKLFTTGQVNADVLNDDEDDFKIRALTKDVIDSTMQMSQKIIELNPGDQESIAVSAAQLTTKTLLEQKFQSKLMEFINELLSPKMRPYAIKTIREFLQLTINSMITMKADPAAINQFRILYNNLNAIGVLKLDAKTLSAAMEQASLAVSKAFETTADNISASGQRSKNLSAGFLKLAGLDFGKEDREGIFKRILEQAEQFSSTYDPKEDFRYLGSSHPAIILRTARMLKIPAYPSIAFANPFMRNLLLSQQLRSNAMVQEKLLIAKKEAAKTAGKTSKEIEAAFKGNAVFVKNSLKAATQFEDQVLGLLNDERIFNERSPRFENFVQFMATQKEILLNGIASMENSLARAPADQMENIKAMIADDKDMLSYQEVLLKKELGLLTSINGAYKLRDILTQLLTATTEEQLAKIRALFTQPPEKRSGDNYYSARIPLDLQLTPPMCAALFAK